MPRPSPPPAAAPLTPADVQNVRFSRSPIGRRGYWQDEVDAFLMLIEAQLSILIEEQLTMAELNLPPGRGGGLTGDDVRDVAFHKPPLGKRGYDHGEVDAFLARAEETLRAFHR